MWGRGPKGNNAACLALTWLLVTSPATHKQIGPFWCWFPGEWVCVHSRTPCVSPTNSPVRLGVSPATATPKDFLQPEVLRLYFPMLESWVAQYVSLPSCSSRFIHTQMWNCLVHQLLPWCLVSSLLWLPVSIPPTNLNEYFFFNSLVVRLPYSLIFLAVLVVFLFLNLLFFFWLWEEAKCIYLRLHLGRKSQYVAFLDWLLSLRCIYLSVLMPFCGLIPCFFLVLNNILFLHVSQFIYLLKEILVVSRFGQLWIKLL